MGVASNNPDILPTVQTPVRHAPVHNQVVKSLAAIHPGPELQTQTSSTRRLVARKRGPQGSKIPNEPKPTAPRLNER